MCNSAFKEVADVMFGGLGGEKFPVEGAVRVFIQRHNRRKRATKPATT